MNNITIFFVSLSANNKNKTRLLLDYLIVPYIELSEFKSEIIMLPMKIKLPIPEAFVLSYSLLLHAPLELYSVPRT